MKDRAVLRTLKKEYPTWIVLFSIYGLWTSMVVFWEILPLWLLITCGSLLLCWFSSLQHELIHGHPTRNARLNSALGGFPLTLWLPYEIYKDSHMAHHNNEIITCPLEDPESFYMTREKWEKSSRIAQNYYIFRNTLLGRILFGPAEVLIVFYMRQFHDLIARERKTLKSWAAHAPGLLAVLTFLVWHEVNLLIYFMGLVYPSLSLTLIRSYAEHKFDDTPEHRSGIIEAGWFWRLLYLNNNFHSLHHENPRLCWHKLPELYQKDPSSALAKNGNYYLPSYKELFLRFLFKSWDHPVRAKD